VPALFTSQAVEATIRAALSHRYKLTAERGHGETGADIIAKRGRETIAIEAISFKSSPPARAKDFFEAFFRAVSRLDKGATRCVMAMPKRFGMGLPQRAKATGLAWRRIGRAFPELEIWLVDTEAGDIRQTKWSEWLTS